MEPTQKLNTEVINLDPHNVSFSAEATKIVVVSSDHKILNIVRSTLECGKMNDDKFVPTIFKYSTKNAFNNPMMEAIDILTIPQKKFSVPNLEDRIKFLSESKLNVIFISPHDYDLSEPFLDSINKICSLTTVFLFDNELTAIDLSNLYNKISNRISFPCACISGVIFDNFTTSTLLQDLLKNADDIKSMKRVKMINGQLLGKPLPINKISKFNSSIISTEVRKRCVTNLKTLLNSYLQDQAEKIEEKIFKASKGNLQEYFLTFWHQQLMIQKKIPEQGVLLGKRSREDFESDSKKNFMADSKIKIPQEWRSTSPSYRWCYSVPSSILINAIQGSERIPAINCGPIDENGNEELELAFRSRRFEVIERNLIGYPSPVALNLDKLEITYLGRTVKALNREIIYAGSPIETPAFWSDYQDSGLEVIPMDLNSSPGKDIIEKINMYHPKATVTKLTKIQHFQQLKNFNLELNGILINNNEFDNDEFDNDEIDPVFLYYGSNRVPPNEIIEDANGIPCKNIDPEPNCNWGDGIHLSANPLYADERAFTTFDEEKQLFIKQIFIVKATLGRSITNEPDNTLRRPPQKKEVNNMPVLYDSITGVYKSDRVEGEVNIVYKSGQVLPAFLIEYTEPAEPAEPAAKA